MMPAVPVRAGFPLRLWRRLCFGAALVLAVALAASAPCFPAVQGSPAQDRPVVVASKTFTESVVLGDMLALSMRADGLTVRHRAGLGGTRVVWQALLRGDVDAYVDYTGTLSLEILRDTGAAGLASIRDRLRARHGLGVSAPLGFSNSYAFGVRPAVARRHGLKTIGDLARVPDVKLGLSAEFLQRGDGWPGLKARYGLPHTPAGLNHDLAYQGIAAGQLDATDIYTTDAEIDLYDLTVLADDRGYFPDYAAVVVYRRDLYDRHPAARGSIARLEGLIDAAAMRRLNRRAKIDRVPGAEVAAVFLRARAGLDAGLDAGAGMGEGRGGGPWAQVPRHTLRHLFLVGLSLGAAILAAIPLGIAAFWYPRFGAAILGMVAVLQTVPSLALFVFMIPALGIGWLLYAILAPLVALTALFLYSLLPVVRNTHAGLSGLPGDLVMAANGLGLPRAARIRLIELPLAAPMILAGIKTAAVINVGTATLGALIGAGGYGEPILTGIRLDDMEIILTGAVPAAVMALLVQGLFSAMEHGVRR